MAGTFELTVPDIGDFSDIPVIEVLIAAGQVVAKDATVVTLESDKATMEVPAPESGVVKDVLVHVGDKVSQGTVLARMELPESAAVPAKSVPTPAVASEPAKTASVVVAGASAATSAPARNGSAAPAASSEPSARAESSTIEITVPDIGDFQDVPVIEVLIAVGDTIAIDAPLISLESDKATMEVPAEAAGTVTAVHIKVGDKASQGSRIATLATSTAAARAPISPVAQPAAPAGAEPAAGKPAAPRSEALPASAAASSAPAPSSYGASGAPATDMATAAGSAAASASATPSENGAVHASPSIRRFARELGVELRSVVGTSKHGRITREDVQGFVKGRLAADVRAKNGKAAASSGSGLDLAPWPKIDFERYGPIERKALSRIQKLSGPALARNWVMIPHVTNNDEADVTELEAFRKTLNAEQKDAKVTMLAFLIKAVAATLAVFPDFNASLDGNELVLKQYYNIGFAADTPNGLVVPVLQGADRKGIFGIAKETAALSAKAREGKISGAEMQGGTFTISSLGGIGGTSFTPIINAPEVAILGVSRAAVKPTWDGHAFVPRTLLPLSLSYDHRVIDGAKAARFLAYLGTVLGDLRRTLL